MTTCAADVARLMVRELRAFERELALFPDDESIWRTVPGVTNSVANLALHLAGNLQHFIGAVLGDTGYVRDRPAEFNRRSGTRAEIGAQLRAAVDAVERTLPQVSDERWHAEYPLEVGGVRARTGLYVLHMCTHAAFHLGQAGYLRRALTGDGQSSGALDVKSLLD